ncbi:DUF3209 family protein [Natronobacterium gregoryi]|uniref:DUF3209 domain-containing protein n=2 Tax=Natronobacterium gregoryi TaxID=44930 RepID=L0ADZ8_NATGS|nr:DUF3209 family protein [Natronobacterium gregoryi]AFZ71377.1 Protein of unknown function (DUF3209) [Natronobacterium gregoryi SP2]ELY66902.1 hypothetical protein C490_11718 [Natronobacterium gregoryi SP2]PLK21243.1 DUF3209 domain-containing protein [Natronobacterium gregoryi SP2]SFI85099.1 Protein of unknown function [Natronobacterium gregoryi]
MACAELEALRLALMTLNGTVDESVKRHAEAEIGDELENNGPIAALASAETLEEIQRHLDAALVDLEEEAADADSTDPYGAYLRGRIVAVRDAEQRIRRLRERTDGLLEDFGETHHTLHETFPIEE